MKMARCPRFTSVEKARKALEASGAKTRTVESEVWKAFLFRYDPNQTANDLTRDLGYWLSEANQSRRSVIRESALRVP